MLDNSPEQRAFQFDGQCGVSPEDKRGDPGRGDALSESEEHRRAAREADEIAVTAEAEPSETPSPPQRAIGTTEPSESSEAGDIERLEASLRWLQQLRAESRNRHHDRPILPLIPPARQAAGSADMRIGAARSPDAGNLAPPLGVSGRQAKMESPRARIRTVLLILFAGLAAASIVHFFAGKSSSAPERAQEAKLVAAEPQDAAPPVLAPPTQSVASTVGAAVSPNRSETPKTPSELSVPRLGPADLQRLMELGQGFMVIGDLTAARIAFRRAALAGDAAAALAMGSTYDPLVLRRIGAIGATPDPDLARTWYERARDFGSPEAPGRINMLANR